MLKAPPQLQQAASAWATTKQDKKRGVPASTSVDVRRNCNLAARNVGVFGFGCVYLASYFWVAGGAGGWGGAAVLIAGANTGQR